MGFGFKVLAGFSQFFVLVSEVNFFVGPGFGSAQRFLRRFQ